MVLTVLDIHLKKNLLFIVIVVLYYFDWTCGLIDWIRY